MTPGGPGAPHGLTPAEMTTVQLLEVAAARSRPHKVVAAELRARAERLRSNIERLERCGKHGDLTACSSRYLAALVDLNAPTGTTRGGDK